MLANQPVLFSPTNSPSRREKKTESERGETGRVFVSQVKERHAEIQTEKVEKKEIFSTVRERNEIKAV